MIWYIRATLECILHCNLRLQFSIHREQRAKSRVSQHSRGESWKRQVQEIVPKWIHDVQSGENQLQPFYWIFLLIIEIKFDLNLLLKYYILIIPVITNPLGAPDLVEAKSHPITPPIVERVCKSNPIFGNMRLMATMH